MATFDPSTYGNVMIPNRAPVLSYYPKTAYETGDGLDNAGDLLSSSGIESAAISYVKNALGELISGSGIEYISGYTMGNMTYAYVRQTKSNGIRIPNAVANIAWKGDCVVAFGYSFVKIRSTAKQNPTLHVDHAISKAEYALNGTHNGRPTKLEYFAKPNGDLALVHVIDIQNKKEGTHYEALVDAHSGEVLSAIDFVWHATYKVLPIPGEAVPPHGFKTLTDPQDYVASPSGWHTGTATEGNNVVAFHSDKTTSESSSTLNFDYSFDENKEPSDYLDAARVNAFYVANTVHDFFYRYGFTEVAFNYQEDNFGEGGKDGDRVKVSVQDPDGMNNSSFDPHPDGTSGTCYLYVYKQEDSTKKNRDSSLDNGIIIHELTHGLTIRMTGGGTTSTLSTSEARGLAEGWSDAMADWVYQTYESATIKDYAHAVYATGKEGGNRLHPYSTSKVTNPLRYSDVKNYDESHDIGQVWANILHNVHAALVDKYGFSKTAMTNPDGTEGNIVFLHLFIDALALQPVRPTFVFARQAWIQADANRYNGANETLLWKAFASRGLGVGAQTKNYVESTSLPSHFRPVIIARNPILLPPLTDEICRDDPNSGPLSYGNNSIVSISVNPQTIITIFGVVAAGSQAQMVRADLIDADLKPQTTVFFDGNSKESLSLVRSSANNKAVTWGPFDKEMTVELTFYRNDNTGHGWSVNAINVDKMKEYFDEDLKTAISVIPIDDGTTLTVTRMTLLLV